MELMTYWFPCEEDAGLWEIVDVKCYCVTVIICEHLYIFCHNLLVRIFGSPGEIYLHDGGDVADVDVCGFVCVFEKAHSLISYSMTFIAGNRMYKTQINTSSQIKSVIIILIDMHT